MESMVLGNRCVWGGVIRGVRWGWWVGVKMEVGFSRDVRRGRVTLPWERTYFI